MKYHLPAEFIEFIENGFYQKVTEKSTFEVAVRDPAFFKDPIAHLALFSDHGVPHVRDVARRMLDVLDRITGLLIEPRSSVRLEFMKGYGLMLAYLHDIGMLEGGEFGRFMHPEFAAKKVFEKAFDNYIELLWNHNAGNVAWRILQLMAQNKLHGDPKVILRELLALSIGHSKSKVPIQCLNNPKDLRKVMIHALTKSQEELYCLQKIEKLTRQLEETPSAKKQHTLKEQIKALSNSCEVPLSRNRDYLVTSRFYKDAEKEAYLWLESESLSVRRFIDDVTDTVRALRAADALRQRGTVFRTSAGYEIFVDQDTSHAIYALRNSQNNQVYLLRGKKPLNAGEANIAAGEIDLDGNLRIALHRGRFKNARATQRAAFNAAYAINDIQLDVIQSFLKEHDLKAAGIKSYDKISIIIEGVEDNPKFAGLVCESLVLQNPDLKGKCFPDVSMQNAHLAEVNRYLSTQEAPKVLACEELQNILDNVKKSGQKLRHEDLSLLFGSVKLVHLTENETIIEAHSKSVFVYIPLEEGLKVVPFGGYHSVMAKPWIALGNTGVIRGSERNATVVAEKEMRVLMIPKQIYLQHWYKPYSIKDLRNIFG